MKAINSILIANRGEIASRVMRTCRKMGIKTIAVYSEADEKLPFVQEADMAICIGEAEPNLSYLNQDKVIAAAKQVQADAIHPGYGFLSENADFAKRCAQEDILFIGPHPKAIEAMGSKAKAKTLMEQHNVPTIPGYKGADQSLNTLAAEAQKIGFPVLLKATAGGGGKGMRIVNEANELKTAIEAAQREAKNAFGDDTLIIEKYIESGRHIEFQIFGDQHGNVIHLFERECSIQRRYQKVLEESPSPILTKALRTNMGEAAVKAAQALQYDNAGTVEFIFDEIGNNFYFLEVNTRLQVEHPVTEAITGLDLVDMQIQVAQGLPLPVQQNEISTNGYAVELRLYAENPQNNFLPETGTIHQFTYPKVDGLRMETAIESGSKISIHYDPMIAKIIVWESNRQAALQKMVYVLSHTVCQGVKTNQSFLKALITHQEVINGNYNTHFIEENLTNLVPSDVPESSLDAFLIAATLFSWKTRENQRTLLRSIPSGWRNSFYDYQRVSYLFNNEKYIVEYKYEEPSVLVKIKENTYLTKVIGIDESEIRISINDIQQTFVVNQNSSAVYLHNSNYGTIELQLSDRYPSKQKEKIKGNHESPMPGKILKVLVKEGDIVSTGDPLIIISSMKMENTIEAQTAGTVEEVFVEAGSNVDVGVKMVVVKEEEEEEVKIA